jgi:hypothetical protein
MADIDQAASIRGRALGHIVDGRGSQLLRGRQETREIVRRRRPVQFADDGYPTIPLDLKHQPALVGLTTVGMDESHFPLRSFRGGQNRGRVLDVDADVGLVRLRVSDFLQQFEGQRAAGRGVDHQVGRKPLANAADALAFDALHRAVI